MKKSFLAILLSALAATASAQNFEFGLNGGLANYTVHNVYEGSSYQDFNHFQSSIVSTVMSLQAMYLFKNYQVGIAIESNTLSYKSIVRPDIPIGFELFPVFQYTDHQTPVKLFINRVFKFKKLEAYGGLSAEYIFTKNQSKIIAPPSPANEQTTQNTTRLAGALQAGATYFITKHIGINAEVAGEYNNFPAGTLDKNIFSVPVTLGVRYKL